MSRGWITPTLEYFECPTRVQTLCTEQLVNLLPRFIHFSAGADERVDDMLIDAGACRSSPARRPAELPRATGSMGAWAEVPELTGKYGGPRLRDREATYFFRFFWLVRRIRQRSRRVSLTSRTN